MVGSQPAAGSTVRGEITRFIPVGIAAVAIDFVLYRGLLWLGVPLQAAKSVSFIAGAIWAYAANRSITFRVRTGWRKQETARFMAVYGIGMLSNVSTNSLVLLLTGRSELGLAIAFLAATGVSASLNFLGMKLFVFAPRERASGIRGR